MSKSREQLEEWVATIDVTNRKILDVGGSQLPVINRVKGEAKEYLIMDLEKPHEVKTKPDIEGDIEKWDLPLKYSEHFSAVFCLEVMEYLTRPAEALEHIYNAMEKNGLLFISFHFIYPVHKPSGKDFLRYTEYGAIKLLNNAGFDTLDIKAKELSDRGTKAFNFLNQCEDNKKDPDYKLHNTQGVLIKAIKL